MNSCNYLCMYQSPVDFNVKDRWLLKYCTESGPPRHFHMYELTWELVCLAASLFRWEQGAAAAQLSLQVPGWARGQLGAQPSNKGFVPPGKSAGHGWPVCMWLIQLQKASSLCVQLSKSTRPRQASASLYRDVCVCAHLCTNPVCGSAWCRAKFGANFCPSQSFTWGHGCFSTCLLKMCSPLRFYIAGVSVLGERGVLWKRRHYCQAQSLGWSCWHRAFVEYHSPQLEGQTVLGILSKMKKEKKRKSLALQLRWHSPAGTLYIPRRGSLWSLLVQLALGQALALCQGGDVTARAVPVGASAGALWHRFLMLMMEEWTCAFSIPSKAIRAASSLLWYSASRGREEPFINISGNTVSTLTCFAHSFSVSRNLSDQNRFTLFY